MVKKGHLVRMVGITCIALLCGALAILWPQWRQELQAENYNCVPLTCGGNTYCVPPGSHCCSAFLDVDICSPSEACVPCGGTLRCIPRGGACCDNGTDANVCSSDERCVFCGGIFRCIPRGGTCCGGVTDAIFCNPDESCALCGGIFRCIPRRAVCCGDGFCGPNQYCSGNQCYHK
jgi:hypothetical protein